MVAVTKITPSASESDPFASILSAYNTLSPALLGSGTTTETSNSGVDPASAAMLQTLLGATTGDVNSGAYSKDAAINDSTGKIQQIIQDGLQKSMPSIAAGAKGAGVYNDSTTQLMTNDLQSRLAAQAQAAVQANIASYANIQNQALNSAANAAKAIGTNSTASKVTAPTLGSSALSKASAGIAGLSAINALSKNKMLAEGMQKLMGMGSSTTPTGAMDSGVGFGGTGGDSALSPTSSITLTSDGNQLLGDAANTADSLVPFADAGTDAANAASLAADSSGAITDTSGLASGASDTASALSDTGGLATDAEAASAASDASAAVDTGAAAGDVADAGSGIGDFFSSFFADGGRVPTAAERAAYIPVHDYTAPGVASNEFAASTPNTHFANGGRVAPSTAYDQNTLNDAASNVAATMAPSTAQSRSAAPVIGRRATISGSGGSTGGVGSSGGSVATAGGGTEGNNNSASEASISSAPSPSLGQMGQVASMMSSVAMGNPLGVAMGIANLTGLTTAISHALGFGSGSTAAGTPSSATADVTGPAGPAADPSSPDVAGLSGSVDAAMGAANGIGEASDATAGAPDTGSSNSGGTEGADTGGDTGGVGAGSDSSGSSGDAGSGGGDSGGGGDGGGGGGSDKNGGKIAGHDTQGKDNIKIHVSGGEYVMPTDVVDHLGVGFFDKLKDMFHKTIGSK